MAKAAVEGTVETGLMSKIQPWQSLFAILTYSIGVYGIDSDKALILYGMILAALGFVQFTTYQHKQAVKEIVAPWLVEQLLKTLGDYLEKPVPPTATGEGGVLVTPDVTIEASAKDMKAQLKAKIDMLEAAMSKTAAEA